MFSLDVCGRQACLSSDLCKSQSPAQLITLCPVICIHEQWWCLFLNCSLTIVIPSISFLPLCLSLKPHTGAVTSVLCLGDAANARCQVTGAFFQPKGLCASSFLGRFGNGCWILKDSWAALCLRGRASCSDVFAACVCCSESLLLLFLKNNGNLEKQMSISSGENRWWLLHPAWAGRGNMLLAGPQKKKKTVKKRDLRGLNSLKV